MVEPLQTNRLNLRPCQIGDLDPVHSLWTHPEVRRFLFDDRAIDRQEARTFIEASLNSFSVQGYGIWLCFEKNSDRLAGFSGLLQFSPEQPPSLIFGLHPHFWGRGYAQEAANSILRYAFEELNLEKIIADADEPNRASIRVLNALGFCPLNSAIANERPLLYYEMRREHWQNRDVL